MRPTPRLPTSCGAAIRARIAGGLGRVAAPLAGSRRRAAGRHGRRRIRSAIVASVSVVGLLAVVSPPLEASSPSVVYHGSRSQPVVALTFDDGWSVSSTQRIFAILKKHKVAATFFPYAAAVKQAPALWRSIAEAGYPIGNHSETHPFLTRLSPSGVRWELNTARQTIERITGRPMLRVYRPPYGAWDTMVQREAAAVGFRTAVLWDVTSADTARHSSWASIQRRALTGTNGSIILMHCGPAVTPAILEGVIRGYRARGFRFVTIPELLGPRLAPWPGVSPSPTPSASPSATPSPGTSATPSPGTSASPTPSPSASPTPSPSGTPSPEPTGSPSPTPVPGTSAGSVADEGAPEGQVAGAVSGAQSPAWGIRTSCEAPGAGTAGDNGPPGDDERLDPGVAGAEAIAFALIPQPGGPTDAGVTAPGHLLSDAVSGACTSG